MRRLRHSFSIALVLLVSLPAAAADWSFRITFPESIHNRAYAGRVYVFLAKEGEPRHGPDWFQPQPFVAQDVEGARPGEPITVRVPSPEIHTFPANLEAKALAGLKAQAVIRFNPWEREVGDGAGNGYSGVTTLPAEPGNVAFTVDRLVESTPLKDNEWCKLFRVRSRRLSDFHQRDVFVEAAVQLPPSYHTAADRRFPVVFEIPGFGGMLPRVWQTKPYAPPTDEGVEFIRVILEGHGPLGHHEFADSDNNGPWGTALIEEFLPAFDKQFRTVDAPSARLLTGHSSGGWSSLWLQITYPDSFGGTWSTAPDPVDFRDFQRIDVYAPGENVYRDRTGARRPLARRGDQPVLWYEDFCRQEDVLGPGGQLHSFEAVFSPRGADGRPRLLWNRRTGEIDPAVAETWKRYDIRLILEENWPALGPKLAGKLHVFMGELDTFYLDGATVLLKESLERLGSDAVVEIHPGKDHGSLMTKELRERITREMSRTYLRRP